MSWSGTDDSGDSGVATYDVLTVTALDPFRNTATGYNGDVHFTSSDRATMLPDDYIFTAADQGVHTFPGLVLETPGVATIMTSDPGQPSITGQATSTLEFPIPTADSQPVGITNGPDNALWFAEPAGNQTGGITAADGA